ncbi:MAG TPA: TetR family transcriptional regulator, partial [Microcella sp.]|nr:TetR family transcriptional regulator [Microcella sp.]
MSTDGTERERASRIPAALRAEQIHEAAQRVAIERGLAGVTQRAVADEAGVTAALVAHYAPSMS